MLKPFLRITTLLQIFLFILFFIWLLLFYRNPVKITPDSYGYLEDARNLMDPGYTTLRPVLFPAFLGIIEYLGLKLSIVSFLINTASLLYLLHICRRQLSLFSRRNTVILICFLLLPGIWSYCGTCLTESILLAVVIWIFIFFIKIIFPEKKASPAVILLYSVLISLLSIIFKPWIMIFLLISSGLLLTSSLVFHTFRAARLSSLILLIVSVLSFAWSFHYNKSKSPESINMALLMVGSGKEKDLKNRLKEDKKMSGESALFIRSIIADIELIKNKYKGDVWEASATNELKILNITEWNAASVNKAFKIAYFERFRDMLGLLRLAIARYVVNLRLGLSSLNISLGEAPDGLRRFAIPFIGALCMCVMVYKITRRYPDRNQINWVGDLWLYWSSNWKLSVFAGVMLLSGFLFCLFLTIAGGNELQRTALPAVLFQLITITYYILNFRLNPKPDDIKDNSIDPDIS